MASDNKPPYRVPSMAEIAGLPWNGFKVASTFSGCGGSSLGYRMAGFKVVWASEFIDSARESYAANKSATTILDGRDIRLVKASEILDATGLRQGELDLLDGSPPCASFSTAGKREKGWGKVKKYSDKAQRTDDLFFEFARLLEGLQPKTFVAENVSGLVKGTAKGYFLEILAKLKSCGYRVSCKVLDAQWLGVPQARQRTIFVGVRNDLGLDPVHPKPLPYRYSIRDALPWINSVESGINPDTGARSGFGVSQHSADDPSPTVMAHGMNGKGKHQTVVEATAGFKLKAVHDTGSPDPSFSHGEVTDRPSPCVTTKPQLFIEKEADISRFAIGKEWDNIGPGGQSEKYFQLVRPDQDGPCPTITAAGGAGSIAGVTHPTERRKFSIAELRRICGFPDDFILAGSYAQQWERLGRAVPPVMMSHVAAAIRDQILSKIKQG